MRKRDIKGQVTPQGGSAYSQAVEMTDVTCILHASGQVGTDVDGTWLRKHTLRGAISA